MTSDDPTNPGEFIVEPENPLPQVTLEQLPEKLQKGVARAGWPALMPVQAKAIPYLFADRDLMIQSRTGSGKTGAFLLPIIERVNPLKKTCQALILVPTRELAKQVAGEAEILAADTGVRTIAVYGGVSYEPQLQAFEQGAHLIVGTPGRVLDHLLKRSLSLKDLRILIYDEADRMLSMGFYPDMVELQRYLPEAGLSGYMFSATIPPYVLRLARQFLHEPGFLSLSRDHVHVVETDHVYYEVPALEKDRTLVRIIEVENPTSAIIFCNTKTEVHYVAIVLQRFGYDADELSSDLSQNEREHVLDRLRKGSLRFLVATDVAARGIDIPEISHIIQYDPPEDPDAYVHRAGRTGRAGGTSGVAITLISVTEVLKLNRIGKQFQIEFEERPLPTEADVEALVSERLTALLEARLRKRDKLQIERMQRFLPLAKSLAEDPEAVQLVAMLLDDDYQEMLHAPPPQPPAEGANLAESPRTPKKTRPRKRSRSW